MWIYAATIGWSALLLFMVQPLISRFILPWFGGSPAVWSTSLLFFQVLLLGGYAYAHLLHRNLTSRAQLWTHGALLLLAAATLPIAPDPSWKPTSPEDPRLHILLLLAVAVGLPYFVLSTTGPLLQAWFARAFPAASPYRLYALSNFGSLLGLLAYPFAVEPQLALGTQSWAWSAGFLLFAAGVAACGWRVRFAEAAVEVAIAAREPRPSWLRGLGWIGLAAVPSVLLLAVTNQICQDVAVVPFLWVLPLSLYLISLVICFDNERWYVRQVFWTLALVSLLLALVPLSGQLELPIFYEIGAYSALLFTGSMVCHGELARRKPDPAHLTAFYLCVSIGGAMGGVFVNLIAPWLFSGYFELHLSMLTLIGIGLVIAWRDPGSRLRGGRPVWATALVLALAGGFGWLTVGLALEDSRGFDAIERNFYGVVRTYSGYDEDFGDDFRTLVHGRVDHGFQFLGEGNRGLALAYYGEGTGVDLALSHHAASRPRRIGVVGLGVGTLAARGSPGDQLRLYEINPAVERLALDQFSFLEDTPADWTVVLGDARLSLERELQEAGGRGHDFDLLVLDAFSGDAPPIHLLTLEAVELYLEHLAEDGLLLFNISNRYIDMSPVLWGIGEELSLEAVLFESWEDASKGLYGSWWMALTRNREWLAVPEVAEAIAEIPDNETRPHEHVALWTDDYSNLVQLLMLWEVE